VLCIIPVIFYGLSSETIRDDKHYYITSGVVSLDISIKEITEVLTDFDGYKRWALKGIDGKDPRSAKYNLILSDIVFEEKYKKFILIFDVNLFWPFSSKGNRIYFDVHQRMSSTGLLQSIEFVLSERTILVPWASLSLTIYGNGDESKIHFMSRIKMAWYIDMFFSLKLYKYNIERRILTLIRNLRQLFHKDKLEKKKKKNKSRVNKSKVMKDKISMMNGIPPASSEQSLKTIRKLIYQEKRNNNTDEPRKDSKYFYRNTHNF
jgi:hypothetical protein